MVGRRPGRPASLGRRRAARGFTLPELMIVLAIMAILGAVAAPSFTEMIASQRAKSLGGELFEALVRTRSEAIKRNTEVTLEPATATRWQDGWRIPNPAYAGQRIEEHGAVPGATVSGPNSVVYLANGRVKGSSAASFNIAVAGTTRRRCIEVDLSGRPNLTSAACP